MAVSIKMCWQLILFLDIYPKDIFTPAKAQRYVDIDAHWSAQYNYEKSPMFLKRTSYATSMKWVIT